MPDSMAQKLGRVQVGRQVPKPKHARPAQKRDLLSSQTANRLLRKHNFFGIAVVEFARFIILLMKLEMSV